MEPFPSLATERLRLRELVAADAPALFAIHGDPVVMRWFGVDPLIDLAAAEKLVETFANGRALPNPNTRWGIERASDGVLLGTCGLFAWNRAWRKAMVGYELGQSAWGHGHMREALRAVLAHGFGPMQLNRIEAGVHPQNVASLKVLAALGFQREGTAREQGFWGGQFHDMHQLALLRRDHVA